MEIRNTKASLGLSLNIYRSKNFALLLNARGHASTTFCAHAKPPFLEYIVRDRDKCNKVPEMAYLVPRLYLNINDKYFNYVFNKTLYAEKHFCTHSK